MFHACKVKTISQVEIPYDDIWNTNQKLIQMHSEKHSFQKMREQLAPHVNFCRVVEYDRFRLSCKRNFHGLFVVSILVHETPLRFVVDTGAQISGILKSKAEALGLAKSSGTLAIGSVSGSEKQLGGYIAKRMRFGGFCYHDCALLALNDSDFCIPHTNIPITRIDGILGWDILHAFDFEIDDIAHELIVSNFPTYPKPNCIPGNFPVVAVLVNNGIRYFGIDTGSMMSWVNKTFIGKQAGTIKTFGMGVHGLEKMEMPLMKSLELRLDRAHISLQNIISGRCDIYPQLELTGVLGNEIFAGRRIRFLNHCGVVLLV